MSDSLNNILVIAGSGMGNIILATPLIRSLKSAYPAASIDVIVPKGRGGILDGNPDVRTIIEESKHEGMQNYIAFMSKLGRRYDLSICTRSGIRSLLYGFMASSRRMGYIRSDSWQMRWHRPIAQNWILADNNTHIVDHALRFADMLGIERQYDLVLPRLLDTEHLDSCLPLSRLNDRYAVGHLFPRNPYKCWSRSGWRKLADYLAGIDIPLILTGSNSASEIEYIEKTLPATQHGNVINLVGKLSIQEVSQLITDSAIYIGPDTGITHIAAASGTTIVTLFGPTDPVLWGPWPCGHSEPGSPWRSKGLQKKRNVTIIQPDDDCCPCRKGGCSDDVAQPSKCLQNLNESVVIDVVKKELTI